MLVESAAGDPGPVYSRAGGAVHRSRDREGYIRPPPLGSPGPALVDRRRDRAGRGAVLFIWELTRPKGRPRNIPFEPEVEAIRGGSTGVGLRMKF